MSIRKYRGSVINLIEVNHLVKQYGTFRAVNDLSFTVEPGQIYRVLGAQWGGQIHHHEYHDGISVRHVRNGADCRA